MSKKTGNSEIEGSNGDIQSVKFNETMITKDDEENSYLSSISSLKFDDSLLLPNS
jgi:hypothetical protein